MTDDTAAQDDAIVMVRAEERLRTHTRRVPARIARLEKYIVTEQRTITVDVRHEEVRLVYDDLRGDQIRGGRQIQSDTDEMGGATRPLPEFVLSEEQIQVRTVTVPVERVRLVIDTVTEQREVADTVRSERIVAEQTTLAD
ncbi:DUF2382 domain-containing protein [uncultured Amnibacterium sp.]|uniref:DUF2382 domain-containing protein n=1 Tax=uncultured Amnibacterium sp. TaxID=1631851 RepID=UPI0035CC16DB